MFLKAQMPNHHLLNGLFSHGGREKYPPAALNWVLAVPNLIHTYIESHKLKNRNTTQERRYINQMFKEDPKKVYRSMKGDNGGPVKDTPTSHGVQKFWGTLWGTSV